MGDKTKIEWTDATWGPVVGCTKVSEGCRNCYAETISERFRGTKAYPNGFGLTLKPERLDQPLRWKKPRRIFVNSMSDLFHEEIPDEYIERVFAVMALAQKHTFQVLTKRTERMRLWFEDPSIIETRREAVAGWAEHIGKIVWDARGSERHLYRGGNDVSNRRVWPGWPLPNVWLGASIENMQTGDERIPLLLKTPAAVRFLSYEPALGPVEIWKAFCGQCDEHDMARGYCLEPDHPGVRKVDWVIAGGESGPGARPAHPEWFRGVRNECAAFGVPFLFKQHGAWVAEAQNPGALTEKSAASALYIERDGSTRPARTGARGEAVTVQRVGKKASGRALDGVIHDGYPEPRNHGGS